jgi:hypothetical protein
VVQGPQTPTAAKLPDRGDEDGARWYDAFRREVEDAARSAGLARLRRGDPQRRRSGRRSALAGRSSSRPGSASPATRGPGSAGAGGRFESGARGESAGSPSACPSSSSSSRAPVCGSSCRSARQAPDRSSSSQSRGVSRAGCPAPDDGGRRIRHPRARDRRRHRSGGAKMDGHPSANTSGSPPARSFWLRRTVRASLLALPGHAGRGRGGVTGRVLRVRQIGTRQPPWPSVSSAGGAGWWRLICAGRPESARLARGAAS